MRERSFHRKLLKDFLLIITVKLLSIAVVNKASVLGGIAALLVCFTRLHEGVAQMQKQPLSTLQNYMCVFSLPVWRESGQLR